MDDKEVRLACLGQANAPYEEVAKVVERANAYYAFVMGEAAKAPSTRAFDNEGKEL